jgi:hypothetical protein
VEHPGYRERVARLVHLMIERLTSVRLRVGALRRRAQRESIPRQELENQLVLVEQEVETATGLAKTLRAESTGSM